MQEIKVNVTNDEIDLSNTIDCWQQLKQDQKKVEKVNLMNLFLECLHWLVIILFISWIIIMIIWFFVTKTNASYDPKIEKYRDIMEDKANSKTVDRIIRSCVNQYNKLENKEWINKYKCIKVSFAIMCNESSCWKYYKNYSIHWIQKDFNSELEAINTFTKTYYKYWYKAKDWSFFYWTANKSAPSRYCTSEESSWSIWHCPNWRKHFDYFYNLIK